MTLADADYQRNPEVFADTARLLMLQVIRFVRRDGEELRYLLDSNSIAFKGQGCYDGTLNTRTRHTQGSQAACSVCRRTQRGACPQPHTAQSQ